MEERVTIWAAEKLILVQILFEQVSFKTSFEGSLCRPVLSLPQVFKASFGGVSQNRWNPLD